MNATASASVSRTVFNTGRSPPSGEGDVAAGACAPLPDRQPEQLQAREDAGVELELRVRELARRW
jgi:hypothetical protein